MESLWHVPQNLMTSINQLHYHFSRFWQVQFWGPEAFWWGGFPKLCQPQIRMWQLPSLRMPSVWSGLLKDHRKSACFKEIPMKQWIWNWMIPNAKSILDLHLAHLRHDRMVAKHLVSCVSEWGEPATPRPQILVGNHPFWSFGCPYVWDIFKSSREKLWHRTMVFAHPFALLFSSGLTSRKPAGWR